MTYPEQDITTAHKIALLNHIDSACIELSVVAFLQLLNVKMHTIIWMLTRLRGENEGEIILIDKLMVGA